MRKFNFNDSSLLVIQQWSSFAVLIDDTLRRPGIPSLSKQTWYGNRKRSDHKEACYDKSKDPLDSDGVCGYLAECKSERQHCELKAHCVVLEDQEVESTNSQDAPDENVGNDPGGQASSIDGSCSVPKNSDICPSQGSRDNRDVNQSWVVRVSEIQHDQVGQVKDKQHLSDPESASNPQHDKAER